MAESQSWIYFTACLILSYTWLVSIAKKFIPLRSLVLPQVHSLLLLWALNSTHKCLGPFLPSLTADIHYSPSAPNQTSNSSQSKLTMSELLQYPVPRPTQKFNYICIHPWLFLLEVRVVLPTPCAGSHTFCSSPKLPFLIIPSVSPPNPPPISSTSLFLLGYCPTFLRWLCLSYANTENKNKTLPFPCLVTIQVLTEHHLCDMHYAVWWAAIVKTKSLSSRS